MSTVSAIVVARGGSVRLPRKALQPFAGRTLVGHKVHQLWHTPGVAKVYVNTDDGDIRLAAVREGAEAMEGADYNNDTRRMLHDSARQAEGDVILWAHPTNPLVKPETYAAALAAYEAGLAEGFDSLASVVEVRRHCWLDGWPFNFNPHAERHPLAAELKPLCFQDGAIFIQPRQAMLENRYFYGRRPKLFPMPAAEVCDVDTYVDYVQAVAMWEATHELG